MIRWRRRLNRLRKSSRFVSGYRFSDTVSSSKSDAPLGAYRHSTLSAACKSASPINMIRHANAEPYTHLPQISVGLIDPVGAGRVEDIEIDGIREGLGPVWHVGRDRQDLAGIHHNHFAVDPEFQRALQHIGNLLVVVAVFGHKASLLEQDSGEHDVLPDNEVAAKQRVQGFDLDRTPRDVAQLSLEWPAFPDGAFERDFTSGARRFRRFSGCGLFVRRVFSGGRFQFFFFHRNISMKNITNLYTDRRRQG